jgi:RNA polymerase sigma-70 factor (ECF subfamily)
MAARVEPTEQSGERVVGLDDASHNRPLMTATTTTLQKLLDEAALQQDDVHAELLLRACERLRVLARRKLLGFPALRRWIETDDVLQQAMLRLHRALRQVRPATVAEFFGLAGLQVRRELHDLHRQHFGAHGTGANHHTDGESSLLQIANHAEMPVGWDRFHELVEALPEEERAVVDYMFINDLTQEETAQILGVSLRTVKRWWQAARIRLQSAIEQRDPRDD